MSFKNVVVVAAKRTAVASFAGSLADQPAHVLGAHVIKALLAEVKLSPDAVDEVIIGQVLTAGVGQNPARQAYVHVLRIFMYM